MNLLNAGCGTWYAEGWVNTDVWENENTKPDVKVDPGEPYPFEDNYFDAIYLGHVLEHMPWDSVGPFLDDMQRIGKPEADILIVGPDVYRTIKLWAEGKQPWYMVLSTMEHRDHNYQPGREHEVWEGAPHHWNCHEERVMEVVEKMGFREIESYTSRIPDDPNQTSWIEPSTGIKWPVVGKYTWQFAVKCRNSP